MRGAEIALKITSYGVMVVVFRPELMRNLVHTYQVLFSIISGLVGH